MQSFTTLVRIEIIFMIVCENCCIATSLTILYKSCVEICLNSSEEEFRCVIASMDKVNGYTIAIHLRAIRIRETMILSDRQHYMWSIVSFYFAHPRIIPSVPCLTVATFVLTVKCTMEQYNHVSPHPLKSFGNIFG